VRSDGGAEACELVRGVAYRELVEAARPHRTEASFRSSAFFRAHGAALEQLLVTPRVDAPGEDGFGAGAGNAAVRASRMAAGRTTAPDAVSLRVLQWNIEKGKQLAGILRHLDDDPWMRRADLILLNEVDCGTARGGNVDQARCIAGALGMHCAWLPTFVECTKGTGSDLDAPGENTRGLHGLAILSRWPILAARAATVPSCHDYFDFHEKRFGGRRGLYTLIAAGDLRLVAATTHLEVRRTPRCRAAQFGAFLLGLDESLAAWGREGLGRREKSDVPVILAGDWNTNTFRRGTLAWSAWEFLRLVTTPVETLSAQLVAPFAREPLFDLLAAERFAVRPCNDAVPTAAQDLGSVEDLAALPASLARGVARAFRLSGRVLRMRLDWIAVRGLQVRGRPVTLPAAGPDGHDLSDHAAIGVDLEAR
jgi:endonuclease/exonuclease/phosphatase family metal-dependent hydrolase